MQRNNNGVRQHPVKSIIPLRLVALALILFSAAFGLMYVPGDAQVHLVIAEQFWLGHPFQYNGFGSEVVVASTSPFWTLLLWFFFSVFGYVTPIVLKIIVCAIWLTVGFLVHRCARVLWGLSERTSLAASMLWFGSCVVAVNGLGGLENVLCSMQLLLLCLILGPHAGKAPGWTRAALAGAIGGWCVLTRLDGGLLAVLVMGLFFLFAWVPAVRAKRGADSWRIVGQAGLAIGVAVIVLIPWYSYQFALTGSVVTDSSIARMYAGRRDSFSLIEHILYFHPKTFVNLATAFLPLSIGLLVSGALLRRDPAYTTRNLQICTALGVVGCAALFFTFVVGAGHFGRYLLPAFPFLFLGGVAGLAYVVRRLGQVSGLFAGFLVAAVVLFMFLVSAADWHRRLVLGQQYIANLPTVLHGPQEREAYTTALLESVDASGAGPFRFAVTEVQLRYYVDERVTVQSLDGRTSAHILDFVDRHTGLPDFEHYFEEVQPDFVELGQWCQWEGFGWLSRFRADFVARPNLICDWTTRAAEMEPGDEFEWRGRTIRMTRAGLMSIQGW